MVNGELSITRLFPPKGDVVDGISFFGVVGAEDVLEVVMLDKDNDNIPGGVCFCCC